MKKNNVYLIQLLTDFEGLLNADFNIRDIEGLGYKVNDQDFILHFRLLCEVDFILPSRKEQGYGFGYNGANEFEWKSILPIRISNQGHDFLSAIQVPDIWEGIKNDFAKQSLKTIKKTALDLAEGYAKKKVEALLS